MAGDPADKYLAGGPLPGGAPTGSDEFIGVPKGYTVPVGGPGHGGDMGDMFRDEGHTNYTLAGPGLARQFTSTIQPHAPLYAKGAEQQIRNMSVENLARLQGQLAEAGLIGPETRFRVGIPDDTTLAAYKKLLGVANNYAVDTDQALSMLKNTPSLMGGKVSVDKDGNLVEAGAAQYDTTGKRVDTTTTNVTALDAEQIANRAYQDALGSNATPKQRKALRAALQAYADAHPQVSTTNSTYDPDTGRELTSNTSTTGGVDAAGLGQIAQDQAQAAPDYAEVQAATTYFNALSGALGPAV